MLLRAASLVCLPAAFSPTAIRQSACPRKRSAYLPSSPARRCLGISLQDAGHSHGPPSIAACVCMCRPVILNLHLCMQHPRPAERPLLGCRGSHKKSAKVGPHIRLLGQGSAMRIGHEVISSSCSMLSHLRRSAGCCLQKSSEFRPYQPGPGSRQSGSRGSH